MSDITYRQVNGYLIPNLTLPPEESNIHLGKWGMIYKDYLLKYKKVLFTTMLAEGKLWQHLVDIDTQAQQMFDKLVEQIKREEGITEQLKEVNQLEWVQRVNNVEIQVSEMIIHQFLLI